MATKKERDLDPRALDVPVLCRQGGVLEGSWPLVGMARLSESLSAVTDTGVAWTAKGELVPVAGGEAELWLQLAAQAKVGLQCQRCLQPMLEKLVVERRFHFVHSEDAAARLDEQSEDDVLLLPQRLDLHALLEDELILALPLVPRHAVCPEPLPLASGPLDGTAEDAAPHPFAALAALRGRTPGSS